MNEIIDWNNPFLRLDIILFEVYLYFCDYYLRRKVNRKIYLFEERSLRIKFLLNFILWYKMIQKQNTKD